jgi:triosephosphate isomerase
VSTRNFSAEKYPYSKKQYSVIRIVVKVIFMKYVIANLKMNLVTAKECDRYLDALEKAWKMRKQTSTMKLILCPSSFFAERFAKRLPQGVLLGSQNVFWETRGSFTGEVSPMSLRDAGTIAVICGHSERRSYLKETNEQVSRKVEAVIGEGMIAVVCVGETAEERDHDETAMVIAQQVVSAMDTVQASKLDKVVIAYEPRWAIGADAVPSSQDIMQTRIMIRKILVKKYGTQASDKVGVLYGGSVKADVMDEVCIKADMDGVLVGRESLDVGELMRIIDKLL